MIDQRSVREQNGRTRNLDWPSMWPEGDRDRNRHEDQQHGAKSQSALDAATIAPVQPALEPANHGADHHDGMTDTAPEGLRLTQPGIQNERRGQHTQVRPWGGKRR
jgi:hypothetical protein